MEMRCFRSIYRIINEIMRRVGVQVDLSGESRVERSHIYCTWEICYGFSIGSNVLILESGNFKVKT